MRAEVWGKEITLIRPAVDGAGERAASEQGEDLEELRRVNRERERDG